MNNSTPPWLWRLRCFSLNPRVASSSPVCFKWKVIWGPFRFECKSFTEPRNWDKNIGTRIIMVLVYPLWTQFNKNQFTPCNRWFCSNLLQLHLPKIFVTKVFGRLELKNGGISKISLSLPRYESIYFLVLQTKLVFLGHFQELIADNFGIWHRKIKLIFHLLRLGLSPALTVNPPLSTNFITLTVQYITVEWC